MHEAFTSVACTLVRPTKIDAGRTSGNARRSTMARFPAALATAGLMTCATAQGGDWLGKTEAGWVMARGNTDTDSANAKVDIAYELEQWKHSLYAAGLYGTNNEIKSAERWEARLQSDYKLTERTFVFGALRYE